MSALPGDAICIRTSLTAWEAYIEVASARLSLPREIVAAELEGGRDGAIEILNAVGPHKLVFEFARSMPMGVSGGDDA